MSWWVMVFLLAMAGMAYSAWRHHHDTKLGIMRDSMGNPVFPPQSDNAALQREVEQLRERVNVLERIAIEDARPSALANEIESLRDKG